MAASFFPSSLKNVLESKHAINCSTVSRVTQDEFQSLSFTIAAQQAMKVSNDLCGSDILSASEIAKRFTRLFMKGFWMVSSNVFDAQLELAAKSKHVRIMRLR